LDELGRDFVLEASKVFRQKQVEQVAAALRRVATFHRIFKTMNVILAGLGRSILGEVAAHESGFKRMIDLAGVYGDEAALMTPAFGVGMLVQEMDNVGRCR
jgi:uncharacterized hydantoinase/oxoprolinase family protein